MASGKKAKSKKEEALAFLDDLDKFTPPPAPAASSGATAMSGHSTASAPTSVTTPRASTSTERPLSSSQSSLPTDAPIRGSTDSTRAAGASKPPIIDGEDPNEALAFLEAQIAQKRPARAVTPVANAAPTATGPVLQAPTGPSSSRGTSVDQARTPVNVPSTTAQSAETTGAGGGWGVSSFWSSASAAVAKARTVADEGYKRVKEQAEKVQAETVAGDRAEGATGGIAGINLGRLGLAEGLGQLSQLGAGVVKGVDLEKLRHDILTRGQSAITELINTVAPPISEHETLQVWLAHDMVGYDGVTSVVEAGVARIMEQTSAEDLEVIFLPSPKPAPAETESSNDKEKPASTTSPRTSLDRSGLIASAQALANTFKPASYAADEERTINPVKGWEEAWNKSKAGVEELVARAKTDSRRRGPDPSLPVTTIPLYVHIQPVLVPLPFPEPPISNASRRDSSAEPSTSPSRSLNPPAAAATSATPANDDEAPRHLTFILSLEDTTHSLRFTTVSQYSPSDWLEVEYDRSDWVEERLVAVLRTGVEGLLQEYVSTRMGLKRPSYTPPTAVLHTPTSTNRSSADGGGSTETPSDGKVPAEAGVRTESAKET